MPDDTHIPELDPSPITPTEAAEEMDDREAEDLAEEVERIAGELGDLTRERDGRSWSELDASTEADRRFRLDYIDRTFGVLGTFAKLVRDPESEAETWKLAVADCLPEALRKDVGKLLAVMVRRSTKFAKEVD